MTVLSGEASPGLEIVGVGLQGGVMPPAPAPPAPGWEDFVLHMDLDASAQADLDAFEAAAWHFRAGTDLNWSEVRELNPGQELNPGLLARRHSGRFVIIQNSLRVQYKRELTPAEVARRLEKYLEVSKLGFAENLFAVKLPLPGPDQDLPVAIGLEIEALAASDVVVFAEPSLVYRLGEAIRSVRGPFRTMPKGFLLSQWQWDLIHLQAAWDNGKTKGAGTRVAVVDLGFYCDEAIKKPALTASFDAHGKLIPKGPLPTDWHGTMCAGLVAAQDDDGITGAAPDCELILVAVPQVTPPNPASTEGLLACALEFCADPSRWGGGLQPGDGAHVISCSIGGTQEDWPLCNTLKLAIDFVHQNGRIRNGKPLGCPIVWAIFDRDAQITTNSINASQDLISVSQCDQNGQRKESGWGDGLAFLAPGFGVSGIVHDASGRGVASRAGASLAAPCTAGVAALVLAVKPDLDWRQVAAVLEQGCASKPRGVPPDPLVGWGVLDAEQAVTMAAMPRSRERSLLEPGHSWNQSLRRLWDWIRS